MFLARRGAARALRAFHTRAELVTCLAATPCQARSLDQRRELSQTRDFSKVTDNQATELYFEEIFEQVGTAETSSQQRPWFTGVCWRGPAI